MKVIIRGELDGIVKYVGHVDTLNFPEVYVGIKLSEAGKYLFIYSVFNNYALILINN